MPKLKFWRNLIILISIVIISGYGGYSLGLKRVSVNLHAQSLADVVKTVNGEEKKDVDFSLFWDVWQRLENNFIDQAKIVPEQMVYGAISGMVASLGDPYTVFLPPKQQKEAKAELGGTFEGIGAQLGIKDKKIVVVAPLKETPAEKAGVRSGDWIVKVDGADTAGWTVPEAVNKIRGPVNTSVVLTILHEASVNNEDISIKRGTILVKSVELTKTYWRGEEGKYILDNNCSSCPAIAHIKLIRFGDQTADEWNDVVREVNKELQNKEIKSIILDIRDNPGGYLQGAVFIASEFIKKGEVVVTQEYTSKRKETYSVTRVGKLLDVKMAVLINKGSASASEIVAGALRDYQRATLVGEKTFGKGSIQEAQDLPGGAGLHITIAKWLLPKGDWINSKGVEADVAVAMDEKNLEVDLQLESAANTLLKLP